MEHNQPQPQFSRVPLFNGRREQSAIGDLGVVNSTMTESAIIMDPNTNTISGEITIPNDPHNFIGTPILWNITRTVSGQVSFKAEPVQGCTWNRTEFSIQFHWPKPGSKHPYKLFVTLNFMNETYSGVLFSPIPICNDELRQNKADIHDTLFSYATQSPQALHFPRTLEALTTVLKIEYYDKQEELVQQLLFDEHGYIDAGKERIYLEIFKTYAQLRKAMALIEEEFFYFDEELVRSLLQTSKPGTFAIVFSSQYPGLLACHYKSAALYPETKYLGYWAPVQRVPFQNYYCRENGVIVSSLVTPPNEGFYQVEYAAPLTEIPIRYTVDDWVRDCVELKYPL